MERTNADEAVRAIQSGHRVFIHTAAAAPQLLIDAMTARAHELDTVDIVHLHTEGGTPYTRSEYADTFHTLYVTESGLMAARLKTSELHRKYIFGLPNEHTEGLDALNGEYAGLTYNNHDDPGDTVMPIRISCEGGTCTGAEVTDIETGAVASDGTAEIAFNTVNSPELGMVTGTIRTLSDDGSTDKNQRPSHIACAVSTNILDTDRNILSCVGMAPDNPEHMFSVLLTSMDE